MKVSVIVPAFNAEATLEAAVHSLLATGYRDLEILVVDDGSSDSTLAIAEHLARQNPEVVRLLTHAGGIHRGVSSSRNLGIGASKGELIAFLDADDLVLPNRFKTSIPMLRDQPNIDGIYELTKILNTCQENECQDKLWHDGAIFGIAEPLHGQDLLGKLMTGIPWHGNAFLCRRRLFQRIGLFDEGRSMAEDCHLWIRAAAATMIEPADPLNVVSVYVRHSTNSYQYSLERRLDLLDAMADAGQWIKNNSPRQFDQWRSGFITYFIRSMIAAEQSKSYGFLLKLIKLCLDYQLYLVLFNPKVIKQILATSRGFAQASLRSNR